MIIVRFNQRLLHLLSLVLVLHASVIIMWFNQRLLHLSTNFLSPVTMASGHITAHKNLPHVTWVSNAAELGDKTQYRTLVRTAGLLSQVGSLIVTLNKMFGWYSFGLLSARRSKLLPFAFWQLKLVFKGFLLVLANLTTYVTRTLFLSLSEYKNIFLVFRYSLWL